MRAYTCQICKSKEIDLHDRGPISKYCYPCRQQRNREFAQMNYAKRRTKLGIKVQDWQPPQPGTKTYDRGRAKWRAAFRRLGLPIPQG